MGFREVTAKIPGDQLDVLIHSPGGLPDATASIVDLLRDKFTYVRFLVPFYAKSAATMLALSGNEIVMSSAAELGPIDPQMPVVLPNGVRMYSPAYALKKQYERAQDEVNRTPQKMAGWIATLSHPSRLVECDLALDQAKTYAQKWLEAYMLNGNTNAAVIAKDIADYLSDHGQFLSHGYPIRWNNP
ncbi:SDH family Clp fold serine proteinase, partial [Candidatus Binatus sp.]|uniref:SDH family Clp fold serine proteinase n=1 Tax=Candidatus Binatus sp. TaxID=2811406 RepID=UPI003BB065D2